MPQTTTQILRCFTLGRYTVRVVDGRLETEGPQPLAGSLPISIEARRDELVAFLEERCGGVWPPAPDSRESVRAEQLRQRHKKTREERAHEFRQKLRKQREEAA